MSENGLSGLPNRPLTNSDLRSLASHPDIGMCDPTYQLEDDPNAIIAFFLELNDQINVLMFNPEDESWEAVESISEPDSLTEESELDGAAIQDRFELYYDEGEVEVAESVQDVTRIMEAFAANFPQMPLTEDQLRDVNERDFILAVTPFVVRKSDDRIISLILSFDSPTEGKRMVGTYGYDPMSGSWQLISTAARSDEEEVFEAVGEETDSWLFSESRYSRDELRTADDPESWIPSG
ncbi:MAG: hypothetical protein ABEH88_12220 [Halobacteriales archaeon]